MLSGLTKYVSAVPSLGIVYRKTDCFRQFVW